MILVDTSVWTDHFRSGDQQLAALLTTNSVLVHPFVIGELALGNLHHPDVVLASLGKMAKTVKAEDNEVLQLIRMRKIAGTGVGYVDAHLLASLLLTPGTSLWTRDKRLKVLAVRLSLDAPYT